MAKKPPPNDPRDDAPLLGGFDAFREPAPASPSKSSKAPPETKPAPKAPPEPKRKADSPAPSPSRPGKAPKPAPIKEVAAPRTATPALPAPVSLDAIVGQSRALGIIRQSLAGAKLHHAWVFHGPEGVGKFTTALAFAAALLDPTATIDTKGRISIDDDSPVQSLLRAGSHPDLHVITKELSAVSRDPGVRTQKQRNIPKAVLEEFLIEPVTRTSTMTVTSPGLGNKGAGGARASAVYIVDEADLIDPSGQNALLKTLEEPAPGRVIILVTGAPERLLTTVWSRCQRVGFAPLSERDFFVCLDTALKALPDLRAPAGEDRAWLLRFAGGSPGLALTAIQTGLIRWRDTIDPMLRLADAGKPPLELGETLAKLVDQWAESQIEGKPTASKEAAKAVGIDHMLRVLASHWREQLRLEAATGKSAEGAGALRAIDLLRETEHFLAANVQPGFAFESLAASLQSSGPAR